MEVHSPGEAGEIRQAADHRPSVLLNSYGTACSEASMAGWLGFLLQASDSFYPTGSYAHSFGLEGLIQRGLISDRESLREFVFASLIPSLRQNDLPIAVHAFRAIAEGNWALLGEISVLASALKSSKEARMASENIGRQRAELCASLQRHPLADRYLRAAGENNWPFSAAISAALEGNIHGAPLETILVSIFYATLAAVIAAAMKLLRIGQNGAQTLLTEALGSLLATIESAIDTPLDAIGWFNPWLDIAAARHETASSRMFIS